MEQLMFKEHLDSCKSMVEPSTCLEIFTYADATHDACRERPLTSVDFYDFLDHQGKFEPPEPPDGMPLKSCLRLILQVEIQPSTFAPHCITLAKDQYAYMVQKMRLARYAVEYTTVLSPFMWFNYIHDSGKRCLQILYRKSDVIKGYETVLWELMLTYFIDDGLAQGFLRGTTKADISNAIELLKACGPQVEHPLLLPIILLSVELSPVKIEQRQRDARNWLRRIEAALHDVMHDKSISGRLRERELSIVHVSEDLVRCQAQVLWRPPEKWLKVLATVEDAMATFWEVCSEDQRTQQMNEWHRSMLDRLQFLKLRLDGVAHFLKYTKDRAEVQRNLLATVADQRTLQINLEMATAQQRLAHSSSRDSQSMKTLAFLGAAFLPGTFLASIFSMTFFNFQHGTSGHSSSVSPRIWIYFTATVPFTAAVIGAWFWWDRKTTRKFDSEYLHARDRVEEIDGAIVSATLSTMTSSRLNNGVSA